MVTGTGVIQQKQMTNAASNMMNASSPAVASTTEPIKRSSSDNRRVSYIPTYFSYHVALDSEIKKKIVLSQIEGFSMYIKKKLYRISTTGSR